jgi:hypothetical protein
MCGSRGTPTIAAGSGWASRRSRHDAGGARYLAAGLGQLSFSTAPPWHPDFMMLLELGVSWIESIGVRFASW